MGKLWKYVCVSIEDFYSFVSQWIPLWQSSISEYAKELFEIFVIWKRKPFTEL